jgi:hypothetical protein
VPQKFSKNPILKEKSAVKTTEYFQAIRVRPDRSIIKDEWIQRAMDRPERESTQADGRIRRWAKIEEMEGRYLRVILLPDEETVHNAFFDRGYKP